MKTLIAYLSYSGNTEEIAVHLESYLQKVGCDVDMYEIGYGVVPDTEQYDRIFLGTFTWDLGSTPDEMKDFVLDVGYKPDNVAVFGSGDTQFGGDDMFCRAVDKLAYFYNSRWSGLKIEQSPRGYQEKYIESWIEGVLEHEPVFA